MHGKQQAIQVRSSAVGVGLAKTLLGALVVRYSRGWRFTLIATATLLGLRFARAARRASSVAASRFAVDEAIQPGKPMPSTFFIRLSMHLNTGDWHRCHAIK